MSYYCLSLPASLERAVPAGQQVGPVVSAQRVDAYPSRDALPSAASRLPLNVPLAQPVRQEKERVDTAYYKLLLTLNHSYMEDLASIPLSLQAIHYPDLSQDLLESSLTFFLTLIRSLLILNKNVVLPRRRSVILSSLLTISVFKMHTTHRFQDCKERCD